MAESGKTEGFNVLLFLGVCYGLGYLAAMIYDHWPF